MTRLLATEAQVQSAIVDYLRLRFPRAVIFAVPNNPLIRPPGMHPGMPDLIVVSHERTIFVEVKGPRGKLKPAQEKFRDECREKGFPWCCVRSVDELEIFLKGLA